MKLPKLLSLTRRTLLAAALAVLATTAAQATLVTYADRVTFDAANPGLPVEGFQNANTTTTTAFTGMVNSSTNNAVFSPGDILAGITIQSIANPATGNIFLVGVGQSSNPSLALGNTSPQADGLNILFGPGVTAVAFDIFQNFGGGAQSGITQLYPISVFGTSGLLGSFNASTPSGSAGFFGVSSDVGGEITRVSIQHATAFDVVDNIAFGGVAAIPEPTTALFGAALIGVIGLARGRAPKRAKS